MSDIVERLRTKDFGQDIEVAEYMRRDAEDAAVEIERLRLENKTLSDIVRKLIIANDNGLKRFCEKHGWDYEATKLIGVPVAKVTDPDLARVVDANSRNNDARKGASEYTYTRPRQREDCERELTAALAEIEHLRGVIRAILAADERGQELPYAEALDAAKRAIGDV